MISKLESIARKFQGDDLKDVAPNHIQLDPPSPNYIAKIAPIGNPSSVTELRPDENGQVRAYE